jgi:hypothetical protein
MIKSTKLKTITFRLLAGAAAVGLVASAAGARAASLPDTITTPKGLNLGSTSFFDGFGRQTPGFSFIEYDRYENVNEIDGPTGQPNPLFKDTQIRVYVALSQLIYTSPYTLWGGHLAFSAALPIVDYAKSTFAPTSEVKLANNGTNIGDLVWGPIWQSPVYMKNGHPFFVYRFQLIISSPTGAVNPKVSINQGVGYWALAPHVAASFTPTPKLEFSTRLNYQYNFPGSTFSAPPPIPGVVYKTGQGGQIIYDNFTASYQVIPKLNVGLDGFVLAQLNPDKTNGQDVNKSLRNDLYVGPGLHYVFDPADSINFNTYFRIINNNDSSGPKANLQYIHRF